METGKRAKKTSLETTRREGEIRRFENDSRPPRDASSRDVRFFWQIYLFLDLLRELTRRRVYVYRFKIDL